MFLDAPGERWLFPFAGCIWLWSRSASETLSGSTGGIYADSKFRTQMSQTLKWKQNRHSRSASLVTWGKRELHCTALWQSTCCLCNTVQPMLQIARLWNDLQTFSRRSCTHWPRCYAPMRLRNKFIVLQRWCSAWACPNTLNWQKPQWLFEALQCFHHSVLDKEQGSVGSCFQQHPTAVHSCPPFFDTIRCHHWQQLGKVIFLNVQWKDCSSGDCGNLYTLSSVYNCYNGT